MSARSLAMLGITLALTLAAHADTPPLGVNLIADPSFEAPLDATPWQAASASLDAMLCPDQLCGTCYRRSGNGVLRFDARATDDVWAIQQPLTLPAADTYELTVYLAGCNGAPTGSITISLGSEFRSIPLSAGDEIGEYRLYTFSFPGAPPAEGAAEGAALAPAPVLLTIANPSLAGANVAIDDVRLVARGAAETCATDAALLGEWKRLTCGDFVQDVWNFHADGTVSLVTNYFYNEGEASYYFGTYCVDTSTTPARVNLHVTRYCDSSDTYTVPDPGAACGFENGDSCFIWCPNETDLDWHGIYAINGSVLTLRVQECLPTQLDGAPDYLLGDFYADTAGPCKAVEDCVPPLEGEGEGTATATDPALLATWTSRQCGLVKDYGPDYHSWTFENDGHFTELHSAYATGMRTYLGTYSVNTGSSPAQIDLHYEHMDLRDDTSVPEGECLCDPGICSVWACPNLDFTRLGVYVISGGSLYLAAGECRPASVAGAWEHQQNPGFCVENYGTYPLPDTPGCLSEGQVEGISEGVSEGVSEGTSEGIGGGEGAQPGGETSEAEQQNEAESGGGEPSITTEDSIEHFHEIDSDKDGTVSESEAGTAGLPPERFGTIDQNGDGKLSPAELMLAAGAASPRHSADTNLDGQFSLSELLRATQFYNAGGYSCAPQADSEDGYLPLRFTGGGRDMNCPAHASDYNPADGVLNLSELLRAIQFYNSQAYTACPGAGEDGFCAG